MKKYLFLLAFSGTCPFDFNNDAFNKALTRIGMRAALEVYINDQLTQAAIAAALEIYESEKAKEVAQREDWVEFLTKTLNPQNAPKKRDAFTCDKCGRGFSRINYYDGHKCDPQNKQEEKKYTCLKCGKKYLTEGSFKKHRNSCENHS